MGPLGGGSMGTNGAAAAGRGGRGTASHAAKCTDHEGQQDQWEPEVSGSGLCDHLNLPVWMRSSAIAVRGFVRGLVCRYIVTSPPFSFSMEAPSPDECGAAAPSCAKPSGQYIIYGVRIRLDVPDIRWRCQAVALRRAGSVNNRSAGVSPVPLAPQASTMPALL